MSSQYSPHKFFSSDASYAEAQIHILTFLVTQMVKNLPTMQETQVQSLGQEDLLEKEMATHSSILTWKIPWTEELGGCSPCCHKELDITK